MEARQGPQRPPRSHHPRRPDLFRPGCAARLRELWGRVEADGSSALSALAALSALSSAVFSATFAAAVATTVRFQRNVRGTGVSLTLLAVVIAAAKAAVASWLASSAARTSVCRVGGGRSRLACRTSVRIFVNRAVLAECCSVNRTVLAECCGVTPCGRCRVSASLVLRPPAVTPRLTPRLRASPAGADKPILRPFWLRSRLPVDTSSREKSARKHA